MPPLLPTPALTCLKDSQTKKACLPQYANQAHTDHVSTQVPMLYACCTRQLS